MNHENIIIIKNQSGSSLLETMVSLFVLAIGLLGTLAMQTKSIQHNQNSYAYSQAIVLANDLSERLKTSADKESTITSWKSDVTNKLPGGTAEIKNKEGNANVKIVEVKFNESAAGLEGKERTISFNTWL